MTRYVVAADGGNSKTDLVLATTGGRVLARVRGVGTNPHRTGFDGLAADLAELTDRARREAGLRPSASLEVGVFHLANLDLPGEDRSALRGAAQTPGGRGSGGRERRVRGAPGRNQPRMGGGRRGRSRDQCSGTAS